MKVKGFRLDYETAAAINFENIRLFVESFVRNGCREEKNLIIPRIERTKDNKIVSVRRKRLYRITLDKRIYLNDCTSLPYGYIY